MQDPQTPPRPKISPETTQTVLPAIASLLYRVEKVANRDVLYYAVAHTPYQAKNLSKEIDLVPGEYLAVLTPEDHQWRGGVKVKNPATWYQDYNRTKHLLRYFPDAYVTKIENPRPQETPIRHTTAKPNFNKPIVAAYDNKVISETSSDTISEKENLVDTRISNMPIKSEWEIPRAHSYKPKDYTPYTPNLNKPIMKKFEPPKITFKNSPTKEPTKDFCNFTSCFHTYTTTSILTIGMVLAIVATITAILQGV